MDETSQQGSAASPSAAYSALVFAYSTQLLGLGPGLFRIENSLSGRGVEIDLHELALLRSFGQPMLREEALRGTKLERPRADRLIDELRGLGILTPVGLHSRLPPQVSTRPSQSMFRLPFFDPQGESLAADFCLFGVPYEGGRTGMAGAASGPDALRSYTQALPSGIALESGHALGWYDYDEDRALLKDATLLDAGNVVVAPGEPPAEIFERVSELVRSILATRAIPVGLGGDHSVTAPILRGFDGREMTIVQFDAHTDLENQIPPEILHHGNVMRRALELPGIRQVVALGLRGLGSPPQLFEDSTGPRVSASRLRRGGVEAMLKAIPKGGPVYVTVDLDVLDPAFVPAVGTPLPGGLSPTLLKELLWALGNEVEVLGMDFVELSPRDEGQVSLAIATELMLTLMGAVYSRQYRSFGSG